MLSIFNQYCSFFDRSLPELPASKTDGDKRKQHESDFHDTKRLLDEARQRRVALAEQNKEIEKKKRKLSSNGAETPSAEKVKSSTPKVSSKSSSSSSKKERHISGTKETPTNTKVRRKVLEDSSDETSDEEWRKGKDRNASVTEKSNKKRSKKSSKKARFEDSSSGEEEEVAAQKDDNPVMTRKLTQKTQADAVLNDDVLIETSHGFELVPEDVIRDALDEELISESSDVEDLIPFLPNKKFDTNLVYLDNLSNPEKVLQTLKPYGGKPKLVRSVPVWLEDKLSCWSLRRQDVDIIFPNEIKKIRNKRKILTEREFDAKMGVESRPEDMDPKKMRIEDILMEEMPDIVTSNTPEPVKDVLVKNEEVQDNVSIKSGQ